ncbi:MAG: SIS domain-containing protein [Spirochaetales bacterium]|nr:SIS domain-containing protein [Spirochaetales bacterium]
MELIDRARNAFSLEAESIIKTGELLTPELLEKAVKLLSEAPRIGTSGCGHSGIACRHFAHLLCCVERPARFISPAEAVHGATGFIQKGDVIVFVSRGGKTAELIPILDICKRKGASVITLTENLTSVLAQGSDVVLPMYISSETDKYNCQGTTSFAVTNAIFDALQAAIIDYTDYQNEKFAIVHPGGAVGERLNKKK